MVAAADIIRFLSGLTLSGGDCDGEPFNVLPWERRFIRSAWATAGDCALSIARGNGKSALCAGIATAHVDPDGPLHRRRGEVVCVASSFDQGRIIFEDVLAFLRESGHDLAARKVWRVQDSANRATVEYRPTGARVRCIGSDPKRAHGLRPTLVLADEPSQWEAAKAEPMLAALRTGLGKVPGSRLIALGTRPADETHWFAKLLDSAACSMTWAARRDAPPFQVRTWRRANPSWDILPSLRARLRTEADEARQDSGLLASFRALRLNQGTSDTDIAVLIDADLWAEIEGEAEPAGPVYWGVDLGTSNAQSAVAAYWPLTGRLDVLAAFPNSPSLQKRGLQDGCGRLYLDCHRRGELHLVGERVVDIEGLLRIALRQFGAPAGIAADRWREAELREKLEAVRMPVVPLDSRGMGFLDGGADCRAFRRACAGRKVVPVPSLLMRSSMSESRTISDPAGNSKLCKGSQGGRRLRAKDDAACAAILAVALGDRHHTGKPKRTGWRYRGGAA